MKKVTLLAAFAVAFGLASCTAQAPKADLKTSVDTLSYAIGMARTDGLTQYLTQMGIDVSSQMGTFMKGFTEGASMTSASDKAYVIGLSIGHNVAVDWVKGLSQQVFGNDSTNTLSSANMIAGFIAGVKNDSVLMKVDSANKYMQTNMERIKKDAIAKTYAANKEAGEKFLAENKEKEGVKTTASGLQYKIIKEGNGAIPADTSKVKVQYRGTLIDGTEFDSSYNRKEPTELRANQVIKGWSEALTMMPVGSKWELYIPQDLAYGDRDTGKIKPFSTLIFEVELVEIVKDTKKK
jgi:FKBP-type peptidyl-prolyl cis-trans isomerase FklB